MSLSNMLENTLNALVRSPNRSMMRRCDVAAAGDETVAGAVGGYHCFGIVCWVSSACSAVRLNWPLPLDHGWGGGWRPGRDDWCDCWRKFMAIACALDGVVGRRSGITTEDESVVSTVVTGAGVALAMSG